MQPFTAKTGYSLIVAAIAFAISFLLFKSSSGILSIIGRTAVFSAVLIAGIFYLELTPDAIQLYYRFKEKWKPK